MAENPYDILGVSKTATPDEIRKAYRSKAKKSHPDLHPGDAAAEARFKTLNAAHDLVSDPEKRGRYDRGEIDGEGQPVPEQRSYYRDYAQAGASGRYQPGGAAGAPDMDDIFGAFFHEQANRPRRGADRSYSLSVPFLDAVTGTTQRLTLPGGATLDVRIPPGLEDGQVLRLRAKGDPGANGAPAGDALITVAVFPHPFYTREGNDLALNLPVTFAEAVLGAKIAVPTPKGRVTLTVPARSDTGTRLRLRGRGVAAHGEVPAGDLHVTLTLVLGGVDEALEAFLKEHPQPEVNPREALENDQ